MLWNSHMCSQRVQLSNCHWDMYRAALLHWLDLMSSGRAQEAAENNDLGEAPYKVLNAGLAGAGALHLAVLLPAQLSGSGGPLTPLVLGTWVAATAVAGSSLLRTSSD